MNNPDNKLFSLKRLQWAHVPLAVGALELVLGLLGLVISALQLLFDRVAQMESKVGPFSWSQRSHHMAAAGLAVLSVALAFSMAKGWRIAKWAIGSVVSVGLIALTPIMIRQSQEYSSFFPHHSQVGTPGAIAWLPAFVEFYIRVSNYLIPILAYAVPALAVLLAVILEQTCTGPASFVNKPPR